MYCKDRVIRPPAVRNRRNFMYARPPCCFSLGLCMVKALGGLLAWLAASLQPVFADRCERWKFDLVSIGTSKASLRLITSNRAKALNRAATCWTLAVLTTKLSSFCLSTPSCSVTVWVRQRTWLLSKRPCALSTWEIGYLTPFGNSDRLGGLCCPRSV